MSAILECTPDELSASASRETLEYWDSLHHVNLVMALEEEFQIQISDDDSDAMLTYADVRDIVSAALGAKWQT